LAKLTLDQAKRKIEREKAYQEAIKKKREIQEKKMIFGEGWRKKEQERIDQLIRDEIGDNFTPKAVNSLDLYSFFDPITVYRDSGNEILKHDLKRFLESEEKYKSALSEIDKKIKDTEPKTLLEEMGDVAEDPPFKQKEVLPLDEDDFDERGVVISSEKKDTPISRAKGKINEKVALHLNRFVPIYNKHVCTCCGMPKALNRFYTTYDMTCSDKIDETGWYHTHICKECANKLFKYYYAVACEKNLDKAMQYMCASLNWYWSEDLFVEAKSVYEDKDRKINFLDVYINTIHSKAPGLTFMNSPFLSGEQQLAEERQEELNKEEAPFDWSLEEARNKKDIVHIFGYDPFEFEEDEEEKKILYADLARVVDEDVQQDYVKLQSALTIVKSFNKVRKLDEKAHRLEQNKASLREQKDLAELKAKELKAISDFSRDSGFSERFKTRQNQGQTTFTGIMKHMNEKKFENELINKYDIQTSATIQAAADASFQAIFNQLNLSEAEAYKLVADQLEEIRKLNRENEKLKENLRVTKYKIEELKLREAAREKGVDVDA